MVSLTHFGATAQSTSKQVCACERNYCPVCRLPTCRTHREARWADGTLNTTYKRDYNAKDAQRDLARRPNELVPSLAAFDGRTTHGQDYTPKRATPWRRDRDGLRRPLSAPFYGQTTYNHFHDGKKGLPPEARRKAPLLSSAPFAGISTKQADFIDWGNQRRPYTAPQDRMPRVPFDGTSTYQDDFTTKPIPAAFQRPPQPLLPSNNMDNHTTYGIDYVAHPMYEPVNECCDNPHHPPHYQHVHDPHGTLRATAKLLGNTSGRTYRVR